MDGDKPKKSEETESYANGWAYNPDQPSPSPTQAAPPSNDLYQSPLTSSAPQTDEVTWTASEYIAHAKNLNWYLFLFLGAAGLAFIVWLLTKDIISVIVILIVGILFGVAAKRQPRTLEYAVGADGIEIDNKLYPYSEFRSFAVMEEGAFSSIMLIPLKRFGPPISIYLSPEDEERIVGVMARYLPIEERGHDMLDRITKRIRF